MLYLLGKLSIYGVSDIIWGGAAYHIEVEGYFASAAATSISVNINIHRHLYYTVRILES
jgi:hypothetical protein